jgi:hypothetical protein
MPGFVGLCWVVTGLAAFIAGGVLFLTVGSANGAPQEAAGAAIALAICVIPYVFTRACQAFTEMARQRDILSAINSLRGDNTPKA